VSGSRPFLREKETLTKALDVGVYKGVYKGFRIVDQFAIESVYSAILHLDANRGVAVGEFLLSDDELLGPFAIRAVCVFT